MRAFIRPTKLNGQAEHIAATSNIVHKNFFGGIRQRPHKDEKLSKDDPHIIAIGSFDFVFLLVRSARVFFILFNGPSIYRRPFVVRLLFG